MIDINLDDLNEDDVYRAFAVDGNEGEALNDSYLELFELIGKEGINQYVIKYLERAGRTNPPGPFLRSGGMDLEKHCDTCAYSYQAKDREAILPIWKLRQHCGNPTYNSSEYTNEMFMEDRSRDYCRFWTPREERKAS